MWTVNDSKPTVLPEAFAASSSQVVGSSPTQQARFFTGGLPYALENFVAVNVFAWNDIPDSVIAGSSASATKNFIAFSTSLRLHHDGKAKPSLKAVERVMVGTGELTA